jgi:S-adenosylmethionine/arginine decarboxylase-like enzyme
LVVDCSSCDRAAVRDADAIRKFCADLVSSIGMVAYGEPVLEHFATHLSEAAAVTGHFCDASGDAYLDVFSCKDFDPEIAVRVVRRHFRPRMIRKTNLYRDAPRAILDEITDSDGASAVLAFDEPAEALSAGSRTDLSDPSRAAQAS